MKDLMIFEGNQVEVFEYNGEVLFNPKDVAKCLDIKNVNDNISRMNKNQVRKLTNKDISKVGYSDFRKLHNTGENFLTEAGVYKLIFKSHKEAAERFQDWVTDEVLPSIRKTGGYLGNTKELSEEEIMAKAFMIAQKTIENQKKQLEEQKPKVIFADAVASSKGTILIRELAKILKQNGIDIGEKRLYKWLRDNGYLIKQKGADYNTPTQRAMNLKLFEVKETNINTSDGTIIISKTTKVTGKGQIYFINKFKEVK